MVTERTAFDFPDEVGLASEDEIRWSEVSDGSVAQASDFLSEFTQAIQERKERQIREYVERQAPQYRPLLKHKPKVIDQVAPNLPIPTTEPSLKSCRSMPWWTTQSVETAFCSTNSVCWKKHSRSRVQSALHRMML